MAGNINDDDSDLFRGGREVFSRPSGSGATLQEP
jgi:hypothetical protein